MPPAACPVCGSTRIEPFPTPFPDPLVRCRGCGARFVHPLPNESALRARYDAEHGSGKWGALFAAADPHEPPRRARLLARLLPGGPCGRRLLDVGCGDGSFLDAARAEGWRPVGLELSASALGGVAGRHPVLVGTTAALGAGARFAAITFWDVLEHLPDPAAALRSALHVLEPGGIIAASMPNAAGTEARVRGRAWRYHDVAAYGHLVHLGPRQLARLLEDAGVVPLYAETRGSVDLRDLLGAGVEKPGARPLVWLLDRASGVLARLAEPARLGNTLVMVARRGDPSAR